MTPRSRFGKLEPEKQEQILDVAAREFADKGYDAASLNRIIDESGVSKGAMYYYFEDKGDLYSTVVERAVARLLKLFGGIDLDAMTAETFWPSFERLMVGSVGYLKGNAWYIRLARSFYGMRRRGMGGPGGRVDRWARRWTHDFLVRGQELGVIRTDLPQSFLIDMTMAVGEVGDRWLLDHWDDLSEEEVEAMIRADLGILRRLLEPEGGR